MDRNSTRSGGAGPPCAIPDNGDIGVQTLGNAVTASGHVRAWADHHAGIDAARMPAGAGEVRDGLLITG